MGRVEAVLGVSGTELAGLHDNGDEAGDESEEKDRIAKPRAYAHTFRVSRWGAPLLSARRSLVASISENISRWIRLTVAHWVSGAMRISH